MKDLQKQNKKLKKLLTLVQEYMNTNSKMLKYGNTEIEQKIIKGMDKLGLSVGEVKQ